MAAPTKLCDVKLRGKVPSPPDGTSPLIHFCYTQADPRHYNNVSSG
jgi:hypothetical protein